MEVNYKPGRKNLIVSNIGIERMVEKFIGRDDTGSRPFLCDGSPIGCQVFLIGINPAVSTYWWEFWNLENGFDRKGWIKKFEEESKDGMKGRKTRLNIEMLRNQILPYRVLDLNLYHKRSDNLTMLQKAYKKKDVCDCLIKNIVPKLIFLHGYPTINNC